jgi:hypothetical protein
MRRDAALTRQRSGTYVQVYHKSSGAEGEKNLKARSVAKAPVAPS